ncbi:hypothetical protein ADK54_33245 [Streptomyces sp. WM6378]|nr:hypothetical protein ADK54_33245 [Streptomyces sp. WM6378]
MSGVELVPQVVGSFLRPLLRPVLRLRGPLRGLGLVTGKLRDFAWSASSCALSLHWSWMPMKVTPGKGCGGSGPLWVTLKAVRSLRSDLRPYCSRGVGCAEFDGRACLFFAAHPR